MQDKYIILWNMYLYNQWTDGVPDGFCERLRILVKVMQ